MNFTVNSNGNTAQSIKTHGLAIRKAAQQLQEALTAAREVTHARNYQTQAATLGHDKDIRAHEERVKMALACDEYGLQMAIDAHGQE
tara:strand:+ start:2160 stop:2420 length:261 start_codon:yes stop_codon:yes gene_type:complete